MQHLMLPGFSPSALCSPVSPWLLAALCLPYIIRFIQCIIVYRSTGNKAQVGMAYFLLADPCSPHHPRTEETQLRMRYEQP
jgi:hypothetical protein